MVGRIMTPGKIPGICEYITIHGERDSADVIKAKDIDMRRVSWIVWVHPM